MRQKKSICLFRSLYLYIATKIIDSNGTKTFLPYIFIPPSALFFFASCSEAAFWLIHFWLESKQKSGKQTAVMMSLYGSGRVFFRCT
jgi:hypothetical protein